MTKAADPFNTINLKAERDMFQFIFNSKKNVQKLTMDVMKEIGYRLIDYSPVGNMELWQKSNRRTSYLPGTFKNNWQVGVDQVPTEDIDADPDPSGSGSFERLSHLGRWASAHQFYFVNNLPYAAVLEYGHHSTQVPPAGIVGRVQMEFPQIVQDMTTRHIANSKAD